MCTERYINLFTDFGFKRAFGTAANKEYLISFLNSVIVEGDPIVDISYRNVEHPGFIRTARGVVYDLYCTTESGAHVIVEMQNAKQAYFIDRSVYYSTFPIVEQAQRGKWDFNLPRIYTIAFMNFTMPVFDADPSFIHTVRLADINTRQVVFDKLTYIYIELPKYALGADDADAVDDSDIFGTWIFIVKNLHKLDRMPQSIRDRLFHRFFEMAEIAAFTKEERYAYEESLKNMRDYDNIIETAKEDGRAEGREEGRAEGREEGRAEGAREIARALKSQGVPVEMISSATGLTPEEIASL